MEQEQNYQDFSEAFEEALSIAVAAGSVKSLLEQRRRMYALNELSDEDIGTLKKQASIGLKKLKNKFTDGDSDGDGEKKGNALKWMKNKVTNSEDRNRVPGLGDPERDKARGMKAAKENARNIKRGADYSPRAHEQPAAKKGPGIRKRVGDFLTKNPTAGAAAAGGAAGVAGGAAYGNRARKKSRR